MSVCELPPRPPTPYARSINPSCERNFRNQIILKFFKLFGANFLLLNNDDREEKTYKGIEHKHVQQ